MSRLTKYLESLMTKSDMRKESLTTNSEYYVIKGIKIGVGDHFSTPCKNDCDIRVVNPLNAPTVYLVQVSEGPQLLTFNLAGFKTFLSNYMYIAKIKSLNSEVQVNKQITSGKKKVALSTAKYKGEYKCPSDLQGQAWALFCNDMSVHCPVFRKLKGKKKRAICKIFEGKTAKYVAAKLKQAAKDSMLKSSTEALRIYLETIK